MSCDVGKAREGLENELWRRWSDGKLGEWAELICHSSISNPSVDSPTSQLILQPFRHFTYVTAHSPTLPLLHLRHNSFSNPSFASPTHKLFTQFTWRTAHGKRWSNRNISQYIHVDIQSSTCICWIDVLEMNSYLPCDSYMAFKISKWNVKHTWILNETCL